MTSILQVASIFENLSKRAGIAGEPFTAPIEVTITPNPADPQNEVIVASGPYKITQTINQADAEGVNQIDPQTAVLEGVEKLLVTMQLDTSGGVGIAPLAKDLSHLFVYPEGYDMETYVGEWMASIEERNRAEQKRQQEAERRRRIVPPPAPKVEEEPKPKRKTRKKKPQEEEVQGPGALTLAPGGMPQSPAGYVERNLGGRLREPVPNLDEQPEEIPEPPQFEKQPPKPPEVESVKQFETIDEYANVYETAIGKGAIAPGSIVHGDKLISAAIEYATARALSGGEEWEGPQVVTLYIDGKFYYYHWTETAPPEGIFRKDQEGQSRLPDDFYNYEYIKKPYTVRFPHRSAAQKKMGDSPDRWVNTYRDSIRQKKRADIPVAEKGDNDSDLFRLLYKGGVELWYALTSDGFYKRISSETLVVSREQLNLFSNMVGTDMFEGDNQITPGIKTSSFMRRLIKTSNRFSIYKLNED